MRSTRPSRLNCAVTSSGEGETSSSPHGWTLAGKQVPPGLPQREGRLALLLGEVADDGSEGPVHLGVHVSETTQEAGPQVTESQEYDAPHSTQRVNVRHGAMRDRITAKGVRHVGEAMGREARQRDA